MATATGDGSRWSIALRLLPQVRTPPSPTDPFEALAVQRHLSRLAAEIDGVHADTTSFARAHRLRAATLAYDDVLGDACRLAGLERPERTGDPAVTRLITEAMLRSAGWTW